MIRLPHTGLTRKQNKNKQTNPTKQPNNQTTKQPNNQTKHTPTTVPLSNSTFKKIKTKVKKYLLQVI
jgi:hypothetical protein